MYYINVISKNNAAAPMQPMSKTIKGAKSNYLNQMKRKPFGLTFDDIDEIIIFKGRKIYGYYDAKFEKKTDIPVDIHNILYGL